MQVRVRSEIGNHRDHLTFKNPRVFADCLFDVPTRHRGGSREILDDHAVTPALAIEHDLANRSCHRRPDRRSLWRRVVDPSVKLRFTPAAAVRPWLAEDEARHAASNSYEWPTQRRTATAEANRKPRIYEGEHANSHERRAAHGSRAERHRLIRSAAKDRRAEQSGASARCDGFNLAPRALAITLPQNRAMLAQLSEIYCSIVVTITTGGLRVGDFQRLKPEHLVHNTCTIIVPGEKSDSSAAPVSVHQIYWPFLQLAISAPLKRSAIAKLLNRACTAAGISRIRVHDLRHCLGHYAAEGGATREELREALRHRSSNMTDIYVGRPTLVNTAVAMARSLEAGDDVGLAVVQRTKETPSRPSSRFDGMTRVELYEMVWRTPITHVA